MKTFPFALAALALALSAEAQQQQPVYGCDSPESKQFDFWVGEWEANYSGGKSRNRITKILDGCVVLEQFDGAPGTKLMGHSVSTYDRNAKQWKQTWVDNTASYLDFTGGMVDGRMVLSREVERGGRKFRQRMVFQDVKPDSFKWLWQRSDDEGANWKTAWEIDYRRVK
jgi:hypothetical protein